jgi:hypothetical protein
MWAAYHIFLRDTTVTNGAISNAGLAIFSLLTREQQKKLWCVFEFKLREYLAVKLVITLIILPK